MFRQGMALAMPKGRSTDLSFSRCLSRDVVAARGMSILFTGQPE
jgi:hypothetical protein